MCCACDGKEISNCITKVSLDIAFSAAPTLLVRDSFVTESIILTGVFSYWHHPEVCKMTGMLTVLPNQPFFVPQKVQNKEKHLNTLQYSVTLPHHPFYKVHALLASLLRHLKNISKAIA
jgi:hypothetical protein